MERPALQLCIRVASDRNDRESVASSQVKRDIIDCCKHLLACLRVDAGAHIWQNGYLTGRWRGALASAQQNNDGQ
jgi:hypothetical protein